MESVIGGRKEGYRRGTLQSLGLPVPVPIDGIREVYPLNCRSLITLSTEFTKLSFPIELTNVEKMSKKPKRIWKLDGGGKRG